MSSVKYRADIDGLRAVAVLSVIIFHINSQWLGAGFLGVDMFFVISGYLITSIIYREMEEERFSFTQFYSRRIKRILPLFFVVVITGLMICNYLYIPEESEKVADSAFSSLYFWANGYFAKNTEYFNLVFANEKPFLHLWSLSIEEQFYFVFPVFLLLIFRVSFLKKHLLKILIIGIFLTLSLGFLDLEKLEILSWERYYLPHTRAGEMLVGVFLAVFQQKKNKKIELSPLFLNLVTGGAFLVLLSCFFLDKVFVEPYFPGVLALIPCVATAVLIYFNQNENLVSQFLSQKIVVWVGKLSYSLYLWHWLILAVMRYVYQEVELPISWVVFAVLLMFFLSILTYYGVENPIRKLKLSFGKNLLYFYIFPALVVVLLGNLMKKEKLYEDENLLYSFGNCHNKVDELGNCIKGDLSQKPKVLFVGNSFVGHLNSWVDKIGKAEGWSGVMITSNSFPFLFDYEVEKEHKYYEFFKKRNELVMNHYRDFPIIVLHYDKQLAGNRLEEKTLLTIKKLLAEGKKVYIITSVVEADKIGLRNFNIKQKISYSPPIKPKRKSDISENLLGFIPDDLGVVKVDLRGDIPQNYYVNGLPILYDRIHFNRFGSEKMAEIFLSKGRTFIRKEDL